MKKLKGITICLFASLFGLTSCEMPGFISDIFGKDADGDTGGDTSETPGDNNGGNESGGEQSQGGGQSQGGNGQSSTSNQTFEEALRTLSTATEYKVDYDITSIMPDAKASFLGVEVIASNSMIMSGISSVEGRNSYLSYGDYSYKQTTVFSLSDFLAKSGMTIESLQMLSEMGLSMLGNFEYDEAKDIAMVSYESEPHDGFSVTLYYDEQEEQYKSGEFYKDELEESRWLSGIPEENQQQDFSLFLELIETNKAKAKIEDGKYIIDFGEECFDLGHGSKLKSMSFSYNSSHYYLSYEMIEESGTEMQGDYDIFSIGDCGHTFTNFEVHCPYNHQCTNLIDYDFDSHILGCAFCGKYLEKSKHAHRYDSVHGVCLDCGSYPIMSHSFKDEKLLLDNGKYALNATVGENGLLYYASADTSFDCQGNLFDGTKGDAKVSYYASNALLLVFENKPTKKITECITEVSYRVIAYENVPINLSEERLAAIEENPNNYNDIYLEALELPTRYDEFLEEFKEKKIDEYVVYSLTTCHVVSSEALYSSEPCYQGHCDICEYCGQYSVVDNYYAHTHTPHVVHPEGASEGDTYFVVDACSVCGHEDHHIFSFYFIDGNHPYGVDYYDTFYEDGAPSGSTCMTILHVDDDGDHLCDLCGAPV